MMVLELIVACQTARLEVLEKEMTKANEEYARAVERVSEFFLLSRGSLWLIVDTENLHARITDMLRGMLNETDDIETPG